MKRLSTLYVICFIAYSFVYCNDDGFTAPSHHLTDELLSELSRSYQNLSSCEERSRTLTTLVARLSNDYSILHLHEKGQIILMESLNNFPLGCISTSKIAYILSVAAFSRGSTIEVFYILPKRQQSLSAFAIKPVMFSVFYTFSLHFYDPSLVLLPSLMLHLSCYHVFLTFMM